MRVSIFENYRSTHVESSMSDLCRRVQLLHYIQFQASTISLSLSYFLNIIYHSTLCFVNSKIIRTCLGCYETSCKMMDDFL